MRNVRPLFMEGGAWREPSAGLWVLKNMSWMCTLWNESPYSCLAKFRGERVSFAWPKGTPKAPTCLVPSRQDARLVSYYPNELCHHQPQEDRERVGSVLVADLLPRCRVQMMRHLFWALVGQGPGSVSEDAQLSIRLLGQHLDAELSVGRAWCPSLVLWSSSLTSAGELLLPFLEKLMCQIAWGHSKCWRRLDCSVPKGMCCLCLTVRAWLQRGQGSSQWKTLEAVSVCLPPSSVFFCKDQNNVETWARPAFKGSPFKTLFWSTNYEVPCSAQESMHFSWFQMLIINLSR